MPDFEELKLGTGFILLSWQLWQKLEASCVTWSTFSDQKNPNTFVCKHMLSPGNKQYQQDCQNSSDWSYESFRIDLLSYWQKVRCMKFTALSPVRILSSRLSENLPAIAWLTSALAVRVILNHACMCAQSRPTLCDPMDCSPPGSSVHGVSQARILEQGPPWWSGG